jgi:hypothetical protein
LFLAWPQRFRQWYLGFMYLNQQKYNNANQHQSLRSLDSLAVACFVHGFAINAQNNQQQVCRCLRR